MTDKRHNYTWQVVRFDAPVLFFNDAVIITWAILRERDLLTSLIYYAPSIHKWTAVAQWLRCCATNRKVAGSKKHKCTMGTADSVMGERAATDTVVWRSDTVVFMPFEHYEYRTRLTGSVNYKWCMYAVYLNKSIFGSKRNPSWCHWNFSLT